MTTSAISWTLANLPSMAGRTVVLTGGTRGIGRAVADALRGAGATVLVGARTPDGHGAAALDLADPTSVRAFADRVATRTDGVDVLINNAGISNVPFALTALGVESHLAVNHLGHAALTHLLMPLLEAASGRIVTVGSAMYAMLPGLDLDAASDEASYEPGAAYVVSKLANALFATELDRRLQADGSPVRSLLADPGLAFTSMHDGYPDEPTAAMVRGMLAESGREALPASIGILYAATAADVEGDVMYGPAGDRTDPSVLAAPLVGAALDTELAAALWGYTQEVLGSARV